MTLDEAIQHCKEKSCSDTECAKEHKQLGEWLVELKQRRGQEKPVSDELEEAAKHYLYSNILYDDVYVGEPTDKDCIEMFKAGAEWQKEQDYFKIIYPKIITEGTIEQYAQQVAYDMSNDWAIDNPTWNDVQNACKLGAKWQKQQMMKDAVDAEIMKIMTQYIDKSALVEEIKRLLAFYSKEIEDNKEEPWAMDIAKRDILQEILSFLDTLEVKEVDLDKEINTYISNNFFGSKTIGFYANRTKEEPNYQDIALCAKYFFELGLKAQKGE